MIVWFWCSWSACLLGWRCFIFNYLQLFTVHVPVVVGSAWRISSWRRQYANCISRKRRTCLCTEWKTKAGQRTWIHQRWNRYSRVDIPQPLHNTRLVRYSLMIRLCFISPPSMSPASGDLSPPHSPTSLKKTRFTNRQGSTAMTIIMKNLMLGLALMILMLETFRQVDAE